MNRSDRPPHHLPTWFRESTHGPVRTLFLGKGYDGSRRAAYTQHTGGEIDVAWAKQIHGADVLRGQPGHCGEGDALITESQGLPLSIATADCVPVLLHRPGRVGAAHAGWRGLASGVIEATVRELGSPLDGSAWIGPSIGPCCYEVSAEVAEQVAEASSSSEVIRPGGRDRPHLDLFEAAELQLRKAGVTRIERIELCTRCESERLWSYRREGPKAGRNLAFIWLDETE